LYTGQLAIVSLKGMEKFVLGSEAFIKEAASRALSNSTNGYIAISDNLEGAYYTNPNSSENLNFGQYLGTKTFVMTPGDKFFFMLVPNGTIQQVYDNPAIGGDKKPLFSIATDHPSDGFSIGQIADITGEGQLFIMEDMALIQESNIDYDDITFRVTGATSKIVSLSELVGSFSASLPSQFIKKLKGESDKSQEKFTAEPTVTNSGDTFQVEKPSITADNDQQEPQSTAATVANSDSQESLPTETSIVDKSDSQESHRQKHQLLTNPIVKNRHRQKHQLLTNPIVKNRNRPKHQLLTNPIVRNRHRQKHGLLTNPIVKNRNQLLTNPIFKNLSQQKDQLLTNLIVKNLNQQKHRLLTNLIVKNLNPQKHRLLTNLIVKNLNPQKHRLLTNPIVKNRNQEKHQLLTHLIVKNRNQ
jgi:hypothetical protein